MADRIAAEGYTWRYPPAQGDPGPTNGETDAFASGLLTKETVLELFDKLSNPLTLNNPDFALMMNHKPDIRISLSEGSLLGQTVVFLTQVFAEPSDAERADPENVG